jgi:hypothetical protein
VKKLLVLGIVAIAIVAITTLYTNHLLEQVKGRRATLDREFEEAAQKLRELDQRFPPRKTAPDRVAAARRTRQAISDAYAERVDVHEAGGLPAVRLRNEALELLATRLAIEKMGPTEYLALSKSPDERAPHAALIEPDLERILGGGQAERSDSTQSR